MKTGVPAQKLETARKRGRPRADMTEAVRYASHLYVITENMSLGDSAGKTREHFLKQGLPIATTPENFRRLLSAKLRLLPDKHYLVLARQALRVGEEPRADVFPMLSRAFHAVKGDTLGTDGAPTEPSLKKIQEFYSRSEKLWRDVFEQNKRLLLFTDLFGIDGETGIGKVASLLQDTERDVLARLLENKD